MCLKKLLDLCRDAPAGRFSLQLWRQHVLANLPMYSILVSLYLDLARSRVSSRCEETLIDMKRVGVQLLVRDLLAQCRHISHSAGLVPDSMCFLHARCAADQLQVTPETAVTLDMPHIIEVCACLSGKDGGVDT